MAEVVTHLPRPKKGPDPMAYVPMSTDIEDAVRERLDELDGVDPVNAQMAIALARAVDQAVSLGRVGALQGVARNVAELRTLMEHMDPEDGDITGWTELVDAIGDEDGD